ncbi:hypothetical protein D3C81_1792920 [compost metagenome]
MLLLILKRPLVDVVKAVHNAVAFLIQQSTEGAEQADTFTQKDGSQFNRGA